MQKREELLYWNFDASRLDGTSGIPIEAASDSCTPVYVLGLESLIGHDEVWDFFFIGTTGAGFSLSLLNMSSRCRQLNVHRQ